MFPVLCFGQEISLKELISIANMDSESFEIYVMNKGYEFNELKKRSDKEGITVREGITMDSFKKNIMRYITWYSKFYDFKRASMYTTYSKSELINIYNELKSLNFELLERIEKDDTYIKRYESSDSKKEVKIIVKGKKFTMFYLSE